jgi:hypothetical protein
MDGDERVGQVDDVMVDVGTWEIRQLVVDTGSWWSVKHVLIPLSGAAQVAWARRLICLDLDLDGISRAPVHQGNPSLAPMGRTPRPQTLTTGRCPSS